MRVSRLLAILSRLSEDEKRRILKEYQALNGRK